MTRRATGRAFGSSAVALSLAATCLAAGPGAAVEPPQCRVLDLSPEFAKDGTAFCAASGSPRNVVYRTTDRGRSWTRVGAESPWLPDGAPVTQVVVSATYATDRTVYLATAASLYVSEDAGATFLPLDLLSGDGSGRRVFGRYIDDATGLGYLAFGNYQSPARLRPPVREPVGAALPANTDRFLLPARVSATSDPVLLAFSGRDESLRSTVYGCSVRLDCLEARGSFAGVATGAWRSPRYTTDKTLYFVTAKNQFTFLRSMDGGRTIKPFTALNAALAPLAAAMTRRDAVLLALPTLTFGPGRRLYVRVATSLPDDGKSPPAQVILRSDDGGARWKHVGARYMAGGRRRGNLPFEFVPHTTSENAAQIHAAPDGRLFAMGDGPGENDTGPWCSVDGGVRWYRVCPR